MHTVPQNEDKFTINNLFYCCEALIFTHPLVYEFLCGLIFMGHPLNHDHIFQTWQVYFVHLQLVLFQIHVVPLILVEHFPISSLELIKMQS